MFIYNSVLNHTRYRSTSPPGGDQVDGLPPALRGAKHSPPASALATTRVPDDKNALDISA